MSRKKIILLITILISWVGALHASHPFRFEDATYKPEIQTVLLHPEEDPLGYPMLMLNDRKQLQLRFDVLGDLAYVYHYTIVHCTHDWQASALQPREYIEGFDDDQINSFAFSLNTLTPYVHHSLLFPGAQLKPKISGNYLLVVYDRSMTAGNILLTRRFMVVDPRVSISASVPQHPRNPEFGRTHQQLDIEVNARGFFGGKPSNSFFLAIIQNRRQDNMKQGLQPSHTFSDRLVYEYRNETVFEGVNQWRNFDMKSFRYQSERIQRIITEPNHFTVKLWTDERRHRQVYKSEPDILGQRLIQARQDQETHIEGDYAWVEFFLKYDAPLTHGDMYIIGALNDGRLDERNKMQYNFGARGYELSLFLKQGYYNYLYGIRERGNPAASTELTEGNHWDTLNEYLVLFYYRQPGTSHDQLIGSNLAKSHR